MSNYEYLLEARGYNWILERVHTTATALHIQASDLSHQIYWNIVSVYIAEPYMCMQVAMAENTDRW